MPTRSRILSLAVAVAVAACGHGNPDPRRPTLQTMERGGFGGWIEIGTTTGQTIAGELISVERATVRILPLGQNTVITVDAADIADGKVYRYVSDTGYGGWGALGGVSTLSHGFFLVFTLPIWLIWTGATAGAEENHVITDLPPQDWSEVAKWSRFPQGMPRGFAQGPPGASAPANR